MESGKFYKSTIGGLVVFCTTVLDDNIFAGVVVDSGRTDMRVGFVSYEGNHFHQHSFEEYTQTQVLANGSRYSIPKGCKAVTKGDVIFIENKVIYSKENNADYKKYARVEDGKMVKIVISPDGSRDIFFRDDCFDRKYKETCSKEEFMKVYNDAIKID